MPLIAYRSDTGAEIESFEIPPAEWATWRKLPVGTFKMGPDRWPAIPKRSSRGLQFFAHAPGYPGTTEPETIEHQLTKIGLVRGLRTVGVSAQLEYPGQSPDGNAWQADVMANLGGRRIALEVQWSYQHWDDYRHRTARYLASGVECIWVVRAKSSKVLGDARIRHWLNSGLEMQHALNRGLPDMPLFWLQKAEVLQSPEDLRILAKSPAGVMQWMTPHQFGIGIGRSAISYGACWGTMDWRYDAAAAGIASPAGPFRAT